MITKQSTSSCSPDLQRWLPSASLVFFAFFLSPATFAQELPNDAAVEGKTIPEWSAEWWKWVFLQPTNTHSELDTDGRFATNGQPDANVFFLGAVIGISGTEHRTFAISEGKYLLVPLLNVWSDNVYTDPPFSISELRQINSGYMAVTTELHASLDGVAITNLFAHRAISPVFSVNYESANNIETFLAGEAVTGPVDPMVGDGYYLMLAPLAPGPHVLNFGGSFGGKIQFTLDITASITVLPVSLTEQVTQLISSVQASNLSQKEKRRLITGLVLARRFFQREQPRLASVFLKSFQSKVRHDLTAAYPALAAQFEQKAQQIISAILSQFQPRTKQ